jgi:hypothetical protein
MDIENVKKQYEEHLMQLPNVVGVGIGEKAGEPIITVFVTQKVPESSLQPQEIIPRTLECGGCRSWSQMDTRTADRQTESNSPRHQQGQYRVESKRHGAFSYSRYAN